MGRGGDLVVPAIHALFRGNFLAGAVMTATWVKWGALVALVGLASPMMAAGCGSNDDATAPMGDDDAGADASPSPIGSGADAAPDTSTPIHPADAGHDGATHDASPPGLAPV